MKRGRITGFSFHYQSSDWGRERQREGKERRRLFHIWLPSNWIPHLTGRTGVPRRRGGTWAQDKVPRPAPPSKVVAAAAMMMLVVVAVLVVDGHIVPTSGWLRGKRDGENQRRWRWNPDGEGTLGGEGASTGGGRVWAGWGRMGQGLMIKVPSNQYVHTYIQTHTSQFCLPVDSSGDISRET